MKKFIESAARAVYGDTVAVLTGKDAVERHSALLSKMDYATAEDVSERDDLAVWGVCEGEPFLVLSTDKALDPKQLFLYGGKGVFTSFSPLLDPPVEELKKALAHIRTTAERPAVLYKMNHDEGGAGYFVARPLDGGEDVMVSVESFKQGLCFLSYEMCVIDHSLAFQSGLTYCVPPAYDGLDYALLDIIKPKHEAIDLSAILAEYREAYEKAVKVANACHDWEVKRRLVMRIQRFERMVKLGVPASILSDFVRLMAEEADRLDV